MKTNRLRTYQQVLVSILLVAMLIPVFALTAYASDKYPYSYTFDTNGGTAYRYGVKSDKSYVGAVSINNGTFDGGTINFQLQRSNGSDLSYESGPYGWEGNFLLYYYSNVDLSNPPIAVRLRFRATGAMSISGNFQP